MSDSSDFSSDFQRIFYTASQLETNQEIEDYLERECANDPQRKKMLLRMLKVSSANQNSQINKLAKQIHDVSNAIGKAAGEQTFLDEESQSFPSIPRYVVKDILGEGAMGKVYLAEQLEPLRRHIALKVIKPGMDSAQVLARFEREKQVLAMLEHPNICSVYDAGMTERGYPYFSMEFVAGESIDRYSQIHSLSIGDRVRLIIEVCRATHHAHERGIIHRDLKPSNVLIKEVDGKATVKIIDFGVAKALHSDPNQNQYETYFKQLIGTPMYMSPEQVESGRKDIDRRCDVYAIGGLLFRLLTGYEPIHRFNTSTPANATIQQLILKLVPPLASRKLADAYKSEPEMLSSRLGIDETHIETWKQNLRGDLETVIDTALKKDQRRRYPTAIAFAEDLERILHDEPVHAKRPDFHPRAKLHPLFQSVLACLAISAMFAGWLLWGWKRAEIAPTEVVTSEGIKLQADANSQSEISRIAPSETGLPQEPEIEVASARTADKLIARNLYLQALASKEQGDFIAARQLLETIPERDRHIEWFLEYESARPDYQIGSHLFHEALAISPDGKLIATNSRAARRYAGRDSCSLDVWDVETGSRLLEIPNAHETVLREILFSPDSTLIATSDMSRTIRVWRTSDGALVNELQCDSDCVPVAIHPNGDALLVAELENLMLWNINESEAIATLTGTVGAVIEDWKKILIGCADGTLSLLDYETLMPLVTVQAHSAKVTRLIVSPDNMRLTSLGRDKVAVSWHLPTMERTAISEQIYESSRSAWPSPDGMNGFTTALSGGDRAVHPWDASTGSRSEGKPNYSGVSNLVIFPDAKKIAITILNQPGIFIHDLGRTTEANVLQFPSDNIVATKLSPNGTYIAIQYSGVIQIFRLSDKECIRTLDISGSSRGLTRKHTIEFSQSEEVFASVDEQGSVSICNLSEFNDVRTWQTGRTGVTDLEINFDGSVVAFCSSKEISIRDSYDGSPLMEFPLSDNTGSLTFGTKGNLFAYSDGGHIQIFDLNARQRTYSHKVPAPRVSELYFDANDVRLVARSSDLLASLDLASASHASYSKIPNSLYADCVLSLDGNRLVAINPAVGNLYVLDTLDGHLVRKSILPPSYVNHSTTALVTDKFNVGNIVLSADNQKLFASLFEGKVAIWDAPVPDRCRKFTGHKETVIKSVFSHDDKHVLSCSDDGTMRIWDFNSVEELAVLKGHEMGPFNSRTVKEAIFSPANDRIVSIGSDRSVRLWSVATREGLSSSLQTVGKQLRLGAATFSPNGKNYATLASAGVVTVFDSADGCLNRMLSVGNPGDLIDGAIWIAYSSDGATLQAMTVRGQTRAWNTKTWEPTTERITEFFPSPRTVSRDGRWALLPQGNEVCLVDLHKPLSKVENERKERLMKSNATFHLQQAKNATLKNNHYAAAFHYGLYLTSKPDDLEAWRVLRSSCYQLAPLYEQIKSTVFEELPVHTRNLLASTIKTEGAPMSKDQTKIEEISLLSLTEGEILSGGISEFQLKLARFEVLNSRNARDFYFVGLMEEAFENYTEAIAVYECVVRLVETKQVDIEYRQKALAKLAKLKARIENGMEAARSQK